MNNLLKRLRMLCGALVLTTLLPVSAIAKDGCPSTDPAIVCTEGGAISGTIEGKTFAFKNIPYAKPPVESLRWRPPQAVTPWDGVRDGSRYGAMCPQVIGGEVKGDEDCLSVNVWRAPDASVGLKPVMVWLTGGGNHSLSGAGSAGFGGVVYNGEALVPEGVVVVTYNLRLGPLGFLAHPVFDAERAEKVSGNYGSLDQIAMLKWIKRNIAAFGGDPDKVFLFGTSAGGGNICALMTSPMAQGLFNGVAMQSSVPVGCELPTLANVENGTGQQLVKMLGCDGASDVAICLRDKSMKDVVAALPGTFTVLPRLYGPNVDGVVFPAQPIERIAAKLYTPVPVIIGNTSGETGPWADTAGRVTDDASYETAIDRVFGASARAKIMAIYPSSAFASPRAAFAQVTTDAEFTCQSLRVARALSKAQMLPVHRFLFSHTLENDDALKAAGANHTIEHPFLFAWQGKYRPTAIDLQIQRAMIGYWSRAAKTGNPNSNDAPAWPEALEADAFLDIGATTAARRGDGGAHCDFWDGVPLLKPHI